jgi:hydroxymethylpyrimidine/phosphomethylpyrimidine kinase
LVQHQAALSIAGSDPSGGAGIQADLKTFTSLGVYGAAVITCLTAQNTKGVAEWQPLKPDFFKKQLNLVLTDLPVSNIKIGMVGSSKLSKIIAEELADFQGEIVYDPVINASDGHNLCEKNNIKAVRQVCGLATVLTPNLDELQLLAARQVGDQQAIPPAVNHLFSQYSHLRLIIVKGGHINKDSDMVCDFLFRRGKSKPLTFHHPRIKTTGSHGTGCTMSSAFNAFQLLGNNDERSFYLAADYVGQLLEKSKEWQLGHGCGPLVHFLYDPPINPQQ